MKLAFIFIIIQTLCIILSSASNYGIIGPDHYFSSKCNSNCLYHQFTKFLSSSSSNIQISESGAFKEINSTTLVDNDTASPSSTSDPEDDYFEDDTYMPSEEQNEKSRLAHILIHNLDGLSYDGFWEDSSKDYSAKLDEKFKHHSGKVQVTFRISRLKNLTHKLIIMMELYDGKYRDNLMKLGLRFHPRKAGLNEDGTFWFEGEKVETLLSLESYYIPSYSNFCQANITGSTYKDNFMTFDIIGDEQCNVPNLKITTNKDHDDKSGKTAYFVLINTLFCLWFCYSLLKVNEKFEAYPARAQRLSLTTICMQTIWNFLLFNQYMNLAMRDNEFQYLAIASFVHFMICFLFELKLILLVWKSNNQALFNQGNDSVRKGLIAFYIKFYVITLALLIIMDFMIFNPVFLIVFCGMIWAPQIYKNVKNKNRKLNYHFVYSLTAVHTFYAFYIKVWPSNMLEVEYDPKFAVSFILVVFVQLVILQLQRYYGSSFFLPKSLRQTNICLVRTEPKSDQLSVYECCICMFPLTHEGDQESNIQPSDNSRIAVPSTEMITYMQTPCGHKYHPECLRQWMKQKLECPFCRHVLPPFDDEDDDSD